MTEPQAPGGNITPRWPQTVGGVVFLAVLAATVLGVVLVVVGPWRFGLAVVGGALVLGSAARLVLPGTEAGMLGVRSRTLDVLTLLAVGAGLVVLALVIPGPLPVQ